MKSEKNNHLWKGVTALPWRRWSRICCRPFFPLIFLILLTAFVIFPAWAEAQQQAPTRLDEVVITATRTPHTLKDVPVETVVITDADIEKTNAQNVMDVLKDIPGISVANHDDVFGTYTWRATLQGLPFDSGYGLVLIDGQRAMGCGQSGGMGEYGIGLNQIPVSMIERIEVVKGPGSALYGSDAVTGVINVITKKTPVQPTGSAGVTYSWYDVKRETEDGDEETADGDRNMSQAYAGYGGRISDRVGYLLSYNYDNADDITAEPLTSDRHAFMGKLDAMVTDTVNLFSKLELSDYQKTGNRDEESYRVSLGGSWQLADRHLLAIKGYTYKWDFVHGTPGDTYGYKNGNVGYNQGELQYTWSMDHHTLTGGGEYQAQGIDYTILNQDSSLITVDETVKTTSFFVQDEWRLWERITLIGGLRYDDHSVFGDEINPKFSAMFRLFDATTLRGSVGRSFKSPTIRQLYYDAPYRHGDFYAQSNRDLQPEKAMGYMLSVEQRLMDDRLMFNVGYFRNDIDDMVVRVETDEEYNGLPLVRYENVEKGWTQGLEFMGRTRLGSAFELAVSYTFTQTENEESGNELTYVPEHSFSLRPSYTWDEVGLGISAGFYYIGRQYTNTDNTKEIDAHTVVDAKITKSLSDRCKLSFEADDIFDSKKSTVDSYYAGRTFAVKLDLDF